MATETTKIPYVEGAAAATPAANRVVTYAKADGKMYSKDDAGTESLMSSGAAATRASLGLDTTDSPEFAGLNVGAATDTTITRTGAGEIAVEGNRVFRVGGADVPVADGGTGASTAAGARTNLGALADTDAVTYLDFTTAAAPANPAAGKVRVYSKTGSHIAQRDSAGAETLLDATGGAGGGGGIGEFATKYNPDHETPATAVAIQEEFNGSTGMAWTAAPATDDVTGYPGFYRFKGSSTIRHLTVAWVPGSTDLTIACRFSFGGGTTGNGFGLGLHSATGAPVEGVYALLTSALTGPPVWSLYNVTASAFGLVANSSAPIYGYAQDYMYVRLTRVNSGPTWTLYYSRNGIAWSTIATTSNKALTVGAIGFRTNDDHDFSIDWIRGWTSVVEKVGA